MCFSAEASFTAALLLGTIGYATLKSSFSRSQFYLAAIPCLFAIQQFSEGVLWISLGQTYSSNLLRQISERIFLTFAFLIWPVWIPLSLTNLEKASWRKNILYAILACGITLSLMNLAYALRQPISVHIVNHSLQYTGHVPAQTLLYPLIIILPCFISSYRYAWVYGLLIGTAYVIADYYYATTMVSVWCFFAALVSATIYSIIRLNQQTGDSTEQDKVV